MSHEGAVLSFPRDQVLLIDGMSVLVRCAKAASRTAPLSHNGMPTGTLMIFINSVIRHLAAKEWDYAVIAWEGVPMRNWRREFWPGYRSTRQYPELEEGSQKIIGLETEQAREFCDAAGLHQDWSPRFEGDDVIANWWRYFRRENPEAEIVIVTSDKDMWQLADSRTACRPVSGNDPDTGENEVQQAFSCTPARLPLVRALAGDPSDAIPGLRGIGLVKAAALASGDSPPLEVFGTLARCHGADSGSWLDDVYQASLFYLLSDLRKPPFAPGEILRGHADQARWRPAYHAASIRIFLENYDMQRTIRRIASGSLPWPPAPPGSYAPGVEPD